MIGSSIAEFAALWQPIAASRSTPINKMWLPILEHSTLPWISWKGKIKTKMNTCHCDFRKLVQEKHPLDCHYHWTSNTPEETDMKEPWNRGPFSQTLQETERKSGKEVGLTLSRDFTKKHKRDMKFTVKVCSLLLSQDPAPNTWPRKLHYSGFCLQSPWFYVDCQGLKYDCLSYLWKQSVPVIWGITQEATLLLWRISAPTQQLNFYFSL